jgi:hypothetical protein
MPGSGVRSGSGEGGKQTGSAPGAHQWPPRHAIRRALVNPHTSSSRERELVRSPRARVGDCATEGGEVFFSSIANQRSTLLYLMRLPPALTEQPPALRASDLCAIAKSRRSAARKWVVSTTQPHAIVLHTPRETLGKDALSRPTPACALTTKAQGSPSKRPLFPGGVGMSRGLKRVCSVVLTCYVLSLLFACL